MGLRVQRPHGRTFNSQPMRYQALLIVLVSLGIYEAVPASTPGQGEQGAAPMSRQQRAYREELAKWKDLLRELRDLDVEYRTTHPSLREPIEERYNELVAEAERQQRELIDAAVLAFADEPGENQEIARFLLGVLEAEMRSDRYDEALRLAQLLIDNDVRIPALFNLAGVAAFNTNQFELAEKHLRRARQEHVLNDEGRQALRALPYCKEGWARERELREAEKVANDLPRVVLETNKGEIELELFENEAPNTVANFISLVEKGFYDGLTFHRVKKGFMAQGGDPKADGTGGPGYTIRSEFLEEDARNHFRGSLSMANAGPHTGGSQFFITFKPTPGLDGKHTVFGRVVRGLDVLPKLQRREPRDPVEKKINPHRNIIIPTADVIERARVVRKRDHPYEPKTRPEPGMPSRSVPEG